MKKTIKNFLEKKLATWASRAIKRNNPIIIGITGSIAKTSTKEAVYRVLVEKFGEDIKRSPGNLNNELGVPLTILDFDHTPSYFEWPWVLIKAWARSRNLVLPKYIILEMAADRSGDISYLVKIAPPKYGIVTTIGPAHLVNFKTINAVAEEKGMLVKSLPKDGVAFLNNNDKLVRAMSRLTKSKVIYFESAREHMAEEIAKVVGRYFNVPDEKINLILKNYQGLPGRWQILTGPKGGIIIDDCYNANPLSMETALRQMSKLAKEKNVSRRIAILGDMLELGRYEDQAHKLIMSKARKLADFIVGVGPAMKKVKPDLWFASAEQAGEWLLKEIKEGDMILIKGSHGIHLEKIINLLKKAG